MEDESRTYTLGQVSALTNISCKALQKYDNNGTCVAHRTSTNRRYYTQSQVDWLIEMVDNKKIKVKPKAAEGQDVIDAVMYIRTYGVNPKRYFTETVKEIGKFCRSHGINITWSYSDVGLASDYNRPHFVQLIQDARKGLFKNLIINDFAALSYSNANDVVKYLTDVLHIDVIVIHRRYLVHPYYMYDELKFLAKQFEKERVMEARDLMNFYNSRQIAFINGIPNDAIREEFIEFHKKSNNSLFAFESINVNEFDNAVEDSSKGKVHIVDVCDDRLMNNGAFITPHTISPSMLRDKLKPKKSPW